MKALGATEVALGDFMDDASIKEAVRVVTKVLHIGPPMHPDEVAISARFLNAARENDVSHFIYYSVMHPIRREVRHHGLKLDVEEAVIESDMPYTIVQPSRYMQHLANIWTTVLSERVHAMPFSTEQQFNVVDLADLADACAVIASSNKHHFATYELAGPQALSQSDMADTISDIIEKPGQAAAVPFDVMEQKARSAGANDDRVEQMRIMNKHYYAHGFRWNSNVLEYILGRPAMRFGAYVKRLAAEVA